MNVIEMSGTRNEGQRESAARTASRSIGRSIGRSTGRSTAPTVTSHPIVEQKEEDLIRHKWNVHGESFELDGRFR